MASAVARVSATGTFAPHRDPGCEPGVAFRMARMPSLAGVRAYSGIFSGMTGSTVWARLRQTVTLIGRPTGVCATIHGSER
jgi:hypothetical protein